MTNREKLRELSSEQLYLVLDRLYHCYGRAWTQSSTAIIEWFDKEYDESKDSMSYCYIWNILERSDIA